MYILINAITLLHEISLTHVSFFLGDSSLCWAFSITTMIRHSLNYFLAQLSKKQSMRSEKDIIAKAINYLKNEDFYKRFRIGYKDKSLYGISYTRTMKNDKYI